MAKSIGILTAGGDSPGLNAAIRAVGKSAQAAFGMHVIGFLDGFRGLMENRFTRLDDAALSGILTGGGTILGTSRNKPDMMLVGGKVLDMTDAIQVAELQNVTGKKGQTRASTCLAEIEAQQINRTALLSHQLEEATGLEARVTILGHVQRGGTPSALDRLLATRLGTACTQLIHEGKSGIMVAVRGDGAEAVPLELVAGKRKVVPPDHPWIASTRQLGTCLGD